jgi:hypothetical protein
MSIAAQVASACAGASAYTLAGGYAVHDRGRRELFPPCRVTLEKRNERGRVTRMEGSYSDGSRILFTYAENRGARLSIPSDRRI